MKTLVERLRNEAPWFGDLPKAANLIENLQAEIAELKEGFRAAGYEFEEVDNSPQGTS